jgi:protein O-mannosyl-transferase
MKNTKKRVQPAAKGPVLKPFVESTPENELRGLLIAVGLTFLVYIPSLFNGFTNWDDNGYVTTNPLLWNLNAEGLIKLLSEPVMGNFHPLTMLTYALEYKLAGLKPFLYHLTNLVLHLLNTWLVYRLVMMLSGKVVVAFITAVLFGIHPMHVESVAWISERKDVLYALFFLLSLIMYVHYVRRNLAVKYLVFSILFFILSCFSKGQAVSLAVLLFALDYWLKRELGLRLVIEKIPYFAVALVFGIIAVSIQHSFGYMTAINMYSFTDRIFFAFYALVLYLGKLILPVNLSCFYPFPQKKDLLMYVSPAIMLAAAFLIWRTYKSTRLWVFGFSFFLITIFLLLQLVPVGGAVISERYTYIPYIGLFFIAGSLADSILQRRAKSARALAVLFTVILISYSAASVARIRVWKDSITLWSDALKKDNMVAVSYNNRASAYKDLKENEKALADYTKALQLNPNY